MEIANGLTNKVFFNNSLEVIFFKNKLLNNILLTSYLHLIASFRKVIN